MHITLGTATEAGQQPRRIARSHVTHLSGSSSLTATIAVVLLGVLVGPSATNAGTSYCENGCEDPECRCNVDLCPETACDVAVCWPSACDWEDCPENACLDVCGFTPSRTATFTFSDSSRWVQLNRDYDEGTIDDLGVPLPDFVSRCKGDWTMDCASLQHCFCDWFYVVPASQEETDNTLEMTVEFDEGVEEYMIPAGYGQYLAPCEGNPQHISGHQAVVLWDIGVDGSLSYHEPSVWREVPPSRQQHFLVEGIHVNYCWDGTASTVGVGVITRTRPPGEDPICGFGDAHVSVVAVDLWVDSDGEDFHGDNPDELVEDDLLAAAALLPVNDNFDEAKFDVSGLRLMDCEPPMGIIWDDPDLKRLTLSICANPNTMLNIFHPDDPCDPEEYMPLDGLWSLVYPEGKLLIWRRTGTGTPEDPYCIERIVSGQTYLISDIHTYGEFKMEGLDASESINDVLIEARLWMNSYDPCHLPGMYTDPDQPEPSRAFVDKAYLTVVRVNIDVTRPNKGLVPESIEETQGSITKVLNPNVGIYPEDPPDSRELVTDPPTPNADWKIDLTNLSMQPAVPDVTYKLRRSTPASGNDLAEIRLFRNGTPTDLPEIGELPISLSDSLVVDFVGGGLVDFELVGIRGTKEVHKDGVRIVAIGCPPKGGRIIYVNPSSPSPSDPQSHPLPYDDYAVNAAREIASGLAAALPNDNVVCSTSYYQEFNLTIDQPLVLAALGLRWSVSLEPVTLSNEIRTPYVPDFESLPCIDGQDEGQLVGVNATAGVSICGLRLSRGRAPQGGALGFNGQSSEIRLDCLAATYCRATDREGGALYCNTASDIRITDCKFDANQGKAGGAIAFVASSAIELVRTMIVANLATAEDGDTHKVVPGGGILADHCAGEIIVRNCLFRANAASDDYPNADPDLEDYELLNDQDELLVAWVNVITEDVGAWGGALAIIDGASQLEVHHSVFEDNSADSLNRRARGGAVLLRRITAPAVLDYSRFSNNQSAAPRRASGGAIDLFEARAEATEVKFTENAVSSLPVVGPPLPAAPPDLAYKPKNMCYGGAVAVHHGGTLESRFIGEECDFSMNRADVNCGGAIGVVGSTEAITGEGSAAWETDKQNLWLRWCTVTSNESDLHGGAIASAGAETRMSVENSEFLNNWAHSSSIDGDGGAIAFQTCGFSLDLLHNNDPRITSPESRAYGAVLLCNFFGNFAGDGGGAIKTGGGSSAVFLLTTLERNTALGSGGGAFRSSTLGRGVLTRCVLDRNESTSGTEGVGGAISLSSSPTTLRGCSLGSNVAKSSGGAIYADFGFDTYGIVAALGWHAWYQPFLDIGADDADPTSLMYNHSNTSGGALFVHYRRVTGIPPEYPGFDVRICGAEFSSNTSGLDSNLGPFSLKTPGMFVVSESVADRGVRLSPDQAYSGAFFLCCS